MMHDETEKSIARRFAALSPDARGDFLKKLRANGLSFAALPIVPADRQQALPLSYAQRGLWLTWQLDPQSPAYNMPGVLHLTGKLDKAALQRSLDGLVVRHESLRTIIRPTDAGDAALLIGDAGTVALPTTDLRDMPDAERESEARRLLQSFATTPFRLDAEAPFRVALLRLADNRHLLAVALHHIAADAWSLRVLIDELITLYEAHATGRPVPLPALPIQFADYAVWQRNWLEAGERERQLAYWRAHLGDEHPVLELPVDRPRVEGESAEGRYAFSLPGAVSAGLRALARMHGASLYMAMAAVLKLVLYRFTGQADLRVGSPIADRQRADTHGVVGYLTNMLVLRSRLDATQGFDRLLAQVREAVLGAQSHQDIPFDALVEALQPERRAGVHPLFQVKCTEQAALPATRSFAGIEMRLEELSGGRAHFDLSLDFTDRTYAIECVFVYAAARFDEARIASLAEAFYTLAAQAVAAPQVPLAELKLSGALSVLQGARTDAGGRDALTLWSAGVRRSPQTPAVCDEERTYSYARLDAEADRLAALLAEQGVGPEVRVGVHAERSCEFVLGMLAVFKAGGVFVPLDPALPADRLCYQLADSGVKLLLSAKPCSWATSTPVLDLAYMHAVTSSSRFTEVAPRPDQAAYVIYTSGSTGRPKGVVVTHGALANYVEGVLAALELPETVTSMAMISTVAADLGHTVLFGALCSGRSLHLISAERAFDPDRFAEYMSRHQIDVLKIVPSHLQALLQAANAAQVLPRHTLIVGGEATTWPLLERIQALRPDCRVINHYGPTETTVGVLTQPAASADRAGVTLPIGRPLANTAAYVLDAELNPVPPGVPGELYISGAGVARGYLARPGWTAERFVPDPYNPGGRLYRSGDRVKQLADGSLEFLGRIDDQVKIRGYRVEPREVAAVLRMQSGVRDAEVIAGYTADARAQLYGYVVAEPNTTLDAALLREVLTRVLPDYMVPAAIVTLDALPLTQNGKVDRKALPVPEIVPTQKSYEAPKGEVEQALAAIWSQVLGVAQIGRHDNFLELGGDSILTLQIVARARKQGIGLAPKHVMEKQTISAVAAVAQKLPSTVAAGKQPDPPTQESGEVALTPIQRWFFDQDMAERHHWNQSLLLEVDEPLDMHAMERALARLVEHHGALRLGFHERRGRWRQAYREGSRHVAVDRLDLSGAPDPGAAMVQAADSVQRGLNLSEGPLLRAAWMDFGPGRPGRLLLVCHHLVVDAVSWRVLVDDLRHGYHGFQNSTAVDPPARTSSFKEWSQALTAYAQTGSLEQELSYWQDVVAEAEPALPAAHPRASNTAASIRTLRVELSESHTAELLGPASRAYRTRIDELLLTALAHTLCEWSGRASVLVELEGHGREDLFPGVDVTRTVGWFTTLYPVRLTPRSDPGASIKAVKECLRRVPNKGIGYGLLRYLTEAGETLARGAVPYVTFNYLGQFDQTIGHVAGWRLAPESAGQARAPASLRRSWFEVSAMVYGGRLRIEWHYSRNLHEHEQIDTLLRRFAGHIESLIAHCARPQTGGVTPSDFPLVTLTQAQLDTLPLAPRNNADIYPLAPMQQGLLLHTLMNPGAGMYLMQDHYRFGSHIDADAFRHAWDRVVERHAALRTAFVWQADETALQIVHREVPSPVTFLDWSGLDRAEVDARLERLLAEERREGFDMARPPLLRLRLIRLDEQEYHLVKSFHHILMDAWCRSLLLTDFFAHYAAQREQHSLSLSAPRPYRDFIDWLLKQDPDAARRYWRETLEGFDVVTPLPRRNEATAAGRASEVGDVYTRLSAQETQALQQTAQQHQLTVNSLVQGAWALLLSRYADQDDVLFGVTVAGRPPELDGIDETVGLFINSIPLRVKLPTPGSGMSVADWLRRLQQQNVAMRQHEHLSLTEIQVLSDLPRGQSLFDSLFVFENAPLDAGLLKRVDEFNIRVVGNRTHTNYPITVVVIPGAALTLQLSYDRRLFDEAVVTRLVQHFKQALEQIVRGLHLPVHALPLLSGAEREQQLALGEGQREAYPFERGYVGLFEAQAAAHGERLAARCRDQALSYRELNRRANRIGHALRAQGVRSDDIVVVFAARGLELLATVLGVFKAGGAYLALDDKHPPQRMADMVASSGARAVVVVASHVEALDAALALVPQAPKRLIYEELMAATHADGDLGIYPAPDQAAYVIYTSGSTGAPKGVVITSQGMLNNQLSKVPALQLTPDDVIAQTASISFDISVWQLLAALLCGARVEIVPDDIARDPTALLRHVDATGITVLESVPTLIQGMLAAEPIALPKLRWMLPTGEATPAALAHAWFERYPAIPLMNAYGPAECADDVALYPLAEMAGETAAQLPIGRPTDNTRLYLLDANLELLPPGVPGELYVAGAGVGRGYLNQPGLTAERFVADPFARTPGARLYRTGDMARYRDDGVLEYLGRRDTQVKVRGFRIELGEIEAQLAKLEWVKEAAVAVHESTGGDRRLVGYVAPEDATLLGEDSSMLSGFREQLRVHLLDALPEYMVPGIWVLLEQLPHTANGKIDRGALPAPDIAQAQHVYEPPQGDLEQALAVIWAGALGVERVGRQDNFFELGGHSLLVMQVVGRIQRDLRLGVPINDLFETQTLARFAARLTAAAPPAARDEAWRDIDAFIDDLEVA